MNKKGFTLVEVIGVVTVLAVILIVAVPSLTKTLKRNEQNKYNDYIDNLKIASETYIVSKLQEGEAFNEYTYISLGDLIDAGYVKNLINNPENNKKLSRDTRIKISVSLDKTFSYDVQEYYNSSSDYNNENLVIHYDAVEYSKDNIFKSLTSEPNYNYSNVGTWTEDGVLFDKNNTLASTLTLNNTYVAEEITISFNVESLDEILSGGNDYTYPLYLRNNGKNIGYCGFRKDASVCFDQNLTNSVFYHNHITPNKSFTFTFVIDNMSTAKLYLNGTVSNGDLIGEDNEAVFDYNQILISPQLYNLKLNNILVYNRALDAEEVQEIYELDKERFGE